MTWESFAMMRIVIVLGACFLRLAVLPVYLQAYLEMAKLKLEEQRSHAGKITNKQIQQQVCYFEGYIL